MRNEPTIRPMASALAACLVWPLRAWAWSWRIERNDLTQLRRTFTSPQLLVFWHGEYLPLFALAQGLHVRVLFADSLRGHVLASLCERFGYEAEILDRAGEIFAKAGRICALAADGPKGPQHVVKRGAMRIALETGRTVVPIRASARPALRMDSRWDRRLVPFPFAAVRLAAGESVAIAGRSDIAAAAERTRAQMEGLDCPDPTS